MSSTSHNTARDSAEGGPIEAAYLGQLAHARRFGLVDPSVPRELRGGPIAPSEWVAAEPGRAERFAAACARLERRIRDSSAVFAAECRKQPALQPPRLIAPLVAAAGGVAEWMNASS
ncbi:conserved hypothetical protein [Hyphomicrobiales bacterium]|jgi:hypothetical protein|nr:conserved hypothetical protein [Hyphomicrobiales bacterium]CAH1702661.1 hypothetical protein BOSEA1005_30533 [Hyphomicrobiales bacterium]CAI0346851.1 conserved hypothetical protein [Hyphomicrobiales bacterium]